jgi:hypothetical protein
MKIFEKNKRKTEKPFELFVLSSRDPNKIDGGEIEKDD